MKRFPNVLLLAALTVMAGSCMDSDETATYPDAAITSFKLGYYDVAIHEINSNGNDTVIYGRESGTMYPMTIDQLGNRIYNTDSLAYGSVLDKVTCTIGSSGTVIYSYADDPDVSYVYSSTDSLDFTRGIALQVVSTDGTYVRSYSLDINVHKVFPDSIDWIETGTSVMAHPCMAVREDSVYVMGTDVEGAVSMYSCSVIDGGMRTAWQPRGLSGEPKAMMAASGKLFVQCGQALYMSHDGSSWSLSRDGVAALYRLQSSTVDSQFESWIKGTDGILYMSRDMEVWTAMGAAPQDFPTMGCMVCRTLATNSSMMRTVLAGNSVADGHAQLWTRLSTDGAWTRVSVPQTSAYILPCMERVAMIDFDGSLFALGSGLETFYQSQDNGITWYVCDRFIEDWSTYDRFMQLPVALKGYDGEFDCKTDSKGHIWLADDRGSLFRACRRVNDAN